MPEEVAAQISGEGTDLEKVAVRNALRRERFDRETEHTIEELRDAVGEDSRRAAGAVGADDPPVLIMTEGQIEGSLARCADPDGGEDSGELQRPHLDVRDDVLGPGSADQGFDRTVEETVDELGRVVGLHERVHRFGQVRAGERASEVLLRRECRSHELGRLDADGVGILFFEKDQVRLRQRLERRSEPVSQAPHAVSPAFPFSFFRSEEHDELVALARRKGLEDNGFCTVRTHDWELPPAWAERKYVTSMNPQVFVHPSEARRRFEEFVMRELTTDDLLEGSLLIALEEYPRLDIVQYQSRVGEMVERVLTKCSASEPDIFRLGHVHSVLFDEERFIGNVGDYYDDRNSFLNEVMDRKVGIPISLSILFLTVARRVGLEAWGVGLPGHFLAKVQFELSEVYVDAFYGGQTMTVPEIAQFVAEISDGEMALRSDHLRAWEPRQILSRALANLHQIYERRGDGRRAMAAAERIEMLGTSPRAVT